MQITEYWLIGLVGRVFASGPGDLGSIPGHVMPKTLKMVLDTSLQYKVRIKGKAWFGLVCWVLWHINLCRLFNTKYIFM